jgi:hypothetical protein
MGNTLLLTGHQVAHAHISSRKMSSDHFFGKAEIEDQGYFQNLQFACLWR